MLLFVSFRSFAIQIYGQSVMQSSLSVHLILNTTITQVNNVFVLLKKTVICMA